MSHFPSRFRPKSFDFFAVPQKFSSEIVRDRAIISPAGRRPTSTALSQVLTRSAEHWHDAACRFCRISKRISDRKNFESFRRAAKFFIRNRARSRRNQPRWTTLDLRSTPTGPHKVGRALARRGLRVLSGIFHRASDRKFSNFFRCRKYFPQKCSGPN